MFGFLTGLIETVAKTTVALPISVVADVVTLGGELNDKKGQTYTGHAIDEAIKILERRKSRGHEYSTKSSE